MGRRLGAPQIKQACTSSYFGSESMWLRPNNLDNLKYQDVLQSEQVLSFLIEIFNKIGAPVTLMYGTLLREFCDGTKTSGCLQPDYQDKEFDTFQIDVYGFECKKEEGLIYFPWDMITISMNSFFPVRRHKRILPFEEEELAQQTPLNNTTTSSNNAPPAFYMPNDPPCLLENIYGAD
eukprot:12844808-Ditylum_brightwellii.AAC.1